MWQYNNTYSSELYHWGIKGQKWGVRRYRNADGSLTEAGKKRYADMSDDAKAVDDLRHKPINQMSNSELQRLNQRQQLESQHKQLNPNAVKKGIAVAGTVAAGMGTMILLYTNSKKMIDIGKEVAKKFEKTPVADDSFKTLMNAKREMQKAALKKH